jgi:fructose-bisphosphate aldolase class 1
MEVLNLGWYVLTATGSVQQLVVFGALARYAALAAHNGSLEHLILKTSMVVSGSSSARIRPKRPSRPRC